ncbi:MAG: RNA polymerase sigma factor, partial [Acidobacteria bacterium]|nr:RNA polymerase sigma factor [Acidobacteriota bacterium]
MAASLVWPGSIGWKVVTMAPRPELGSGGALELDLDAPLVTRCLRGDEVAWEGLVKLHTRRIYSICYRFTGRA